MNLKYIQNKVIRNKSKKVLIKLTIFKKNRILIRGRLELLSACLIAQVCHNSNVFRIWKAGLYKLPASCQSQCHVQISKHVSQCLNR